MEINAELFATLRTDYVINIMDKYFGEKWYNDENRRISYKGYSHPSFRSEMIEALSADLLGE